MPYKIQVDGTILRVSFIGECTKADLSAMASELLRLETGLERTPDRLVDASLLDASATDFETIWPVAEARRKQVFPNNFRSALVAPTPVAYGLARMFQNINSNPQIETQVFKTMAEAEAWLGVAPKK